MSVIWCLEDDTAARELELYVLHNAGFDVQGFSCAEEFLHAVETDIPDLLLLDVMLPDGDGLDILKGLRAKPDTADLPVLMTTAKGTEFDKVSGLDGGADGYLVKPFGMMEMLSLIRAVLRRASRSSEAKQETVSAGDIVMNLSAHSVTSAGQVVELSRKEYTLLQLFLTHPDRVYTRDDLLNIVWNNDYAGETRTVDVHIAGLRTKLGTAGSMIRTIRGIGYKLVLEDEV